jgi:predicted small lipoprotein YifL
VWLAGALAACGRAGPPVRSRPAASPAPAEAAPQPSEESEEESP